MSTEKEGLKMDFTTEIDTFTTKVLVDENQDFSSAVIPQKIFNYKVYKHNKLIECKSNFSAMEHRIIVFALAQITAKDENLKMYRIHIQDVLGKAFGKKTQVYNDYNTVRKAVQRLHKCSIGIEEGKQWRSYAFITKAQGEYGKNYIEVQFHEDIQKFLLGLKSQYTSYTLENVIKFKKSYSLRIYEFCKQYLNLGSRSMQLDYLRNLLSLEKKYLNFSHFKKSVLNPALEEINKYSDIKVQFKAFKDGKAVDKIVFLIQKNLIKLPDNLISTDNIKKLESLGFEDYQIDTIRKKNTEKKIAHVLELFDKHIDKINFPKPWIENALEKNYVSNEDYKNQFKKENEEDCDEIMRKKNKQISLKKMEIRDSQSRIENFKKDLDFYHIENRLRPGDVMRFPEDFSVADAVQYCEEKLQIEQSLLTGLEREIENLLSY